MPRNLNEQRTAPGLIPTNDAFDGFISHCLQVLASTTAGIAIYILSCLCPEDFNVILDLVRFDLSQPHHHEYLQEKRVHVMSSSSASMISHLRAYTDTLPTQIYCRLWLEVAQRWLLTCPMDEEYYQPDETSGDLFCQKLRGELLDRILDIS